MNILNKKLDEFLQYYGYTLRDFQIKAIQNTHSRINQLVISPTGSGKTFGAFFGILNELLDLTEKKQLENKTYAIYISPLRALTYDIEKNLQEIMQFAQSNEINIAIWTSDIKNKQKYKKNTPHIILTTPESFALILLSGFANFDWIIVDEIHSLIENKRSLYLDLMLKFAKTLNFFSITYLTATDLKNMANILEVDDVINANLKKELKVYLINSEKRVDEIIKIKKEFNFRTIIIFTNTRSLAEEIGIKLKKRNFKVAVHHSSLSYTVRRKIEDDMKKGNLDFIVSSTSLELGIDIGAIDATILYGSPKTITKAVQRIGRSGHKLNKRSYGFFIALNIRDLLEIIGVIQGIVKNEKEEVKVIQNAVDVVSHFLVYIGEFNRRKIKLNQIEEVLNLLEIYRIVKKSPFYKTFSLDTLLDIAEMYHKHRILKFVEKNEKIITKKYDFLNAIPILNIPSYKVLKNLGPIKHQDNFVVKEKNRVIGFLDEFFVERLIKNDRISLGGNFYEVSELKDNVIKVKKVKSGKISVWYSDYLPISYEVANNIRRFVKDVFDIFTKYISSDKMNFLLGKNDDKIIQEIQQKYPFFDRKGFYELKNIFVYYYPEYIENDIIVEYSNYKEKYLVVHTFFGKKFNDALSRVMAKIVSDKDVEIGIDDISFYLHAGSINVNKIKRLKEMSEEKLKSILKQTIENTLSYRKLLKQLTRKMLFIERDIVSIKKMANEVIKEEGFREILYDKLDFETFIKEMKNTNFRIYLDTLSPLSITLIENAYRDLLMNQSTYEFLKEMKEILKAKLNLKMGKLAKNSQLKL